MANASQAGITLPLHATASVDVRGAGTNRNRRQIVNAMAQVHGPAASNPLVVVRGHLRGVSPRPSIKVASKLATLWRMPHKQALPSRCMQLRAWTCGARGRAGIGGGIRQRHGPGAWPCRFHQPWPRCMVVAFRFTRVGFVPNRIRVACPERIEWDSSLIELRLPVPNGLKGIRPQSRVACPERIEWDSSLIELRFACPESNVVNAMAQVHGPAASNPLLVACGHVRGMPPPTVH